MVSIKAKLAINIIFLALSLMGSMTVSAMGSTISDDEPRGQPKAVVILLHGLNLKPSKMDDWSAALKNRGAHVIRFALYGHAGVDEHMKTVNADIWRQEFVNLVEVAKRKAKELDDVPLYFLGFSLGALVALEWSANNSSGDKFEKMVLIAPAISLSSFYRSLVDGASWLLGDNMVVPSRSPEEYRANVKGTSVAAYRALFALTDLLETKNYQGTNVDTLVLIDQNDELVSSDRVREVIKQFKLSKWKLEIVDNRFAYDNYGFRHLMVDQQATGETLWKDLSDKVTAHFGL